MCAYKGEGGEEGRGKEDYGEEDGIEEDILDGMGECGERHVWWLGRGRGQSPRCPHQSMMEHWIIFCRSFSYSTSQIKGTTTYQRQGRLKASQLEEWKEGREWLVERGRRGGEGGRRIGGWG